MKRRMRNIKKSQLRAHKRGAARRYNAYRYLSPYFGVNPFDGQVDYVDRYGIGYIFHTRDI